MTMAPLLSMQTTTGLRSFFIYYIYISKRIHFYPSCSIPVERQPLKAGRPASIASVSSTDSINLDDLIKNNYTEKVDDETDLPNLAGLDLDDSTDDFWKMDDVSGYATTRTYRLCS